MRVLVLVVLCGRSTSLDPGDVLFANECCAGLDGGGASAALLPSTCGVLSAGTCAYNATLLGCNGVYGGTTISTIGSFDNFERSFVLSAVIKREDDSTIIGRNASVKWFACRTDGGISVLRGTGSGDVLTARHSFVGRYSAVSSFPGGHIAASSTTLALVALPSLPIIFSTIPKEPFAYVSPGSGSVIRVEAESWPRGSARWHVDGVDATQQGWQDGLSAFSISVDPYDYGRDVNVTFVMENLLGLASHTITLAIGRPPVLQPPDPPWTLVSEGSNASIRVLLVQAAPPPIYTWVLASSPLPMFHTTAASLAISSAQTPDDGLYMVQACNQFGCSRQVHASLVVVLAPPIVVEDLPLHLTVTSGDTVRISVVLQGRGLTVTWFSGDTVLGAESLLQDTLHVSNSSASLRVNLTWLAVTTEDASANVTLLASNAAGWARSTPMRLDVLPPPWQLDCGNAVVYSTLQPSNGVRVHALVQPVARVTPPVCSGSFLDGPRLALLLGQDAGAVLLPPPSSSLAECNASLALSYAVDSGPFLADDLRACGWGAPVYAPGASNETTDGARMHFDRLRGLSPGTDFPVCTATVAVAAEPVMGAGLTGLQRCTAAISLPRVQTAPLPTPSRTSTASRSAIASPSSSGTQSGSPTPTTAGAPTASVSPTPSAGWVLVPTESPSSTATTSMSPTSSPSTSVDPLMALAARAVRVVQADVAGVQLTGVLIGVCLGALAAAASVSAYRKRRARKPKRAHSAMRAAQQPWWRRLASSALTRGEDALAPFAASVSAWDVLCWAQFVVFTDALALAHHPAYASFAGGFAPTLLLIPARVINAAAGLRAGPRWDGDGLASLQGVFDAMHIRFGEAVQTDYRGSLLEDGLVVASVAGGGTPLSDAALVAHAISAGTASVPRLATHVGVASGDLVLYSGLSAALLLVSVALVAAPLAYCAYLATVAVSRRYPSKYTVALSWQDVLTWTCRLCFKCTLALAPALLLSSLWTWKAGSSHVCTGVATAAAVFTASVLATRFMTARIHGQHAASGGLGYALTSPSLAATAVIFYVVLFPVATAAGSSAPLVQPVSLLVLCASTSLAAGCYSTYAMGGDSDCERVYVLASSVGLEGLVLLLLLASQAGDVSEARLLSLRASATGTIAVIMMAVTAGTLLAVHAFFVRRQEEVAASAKLGSGLTASALRRLSSTTIERRSLRVPIAVVPEEIGLNRSMPGGATWRDVPGALSRWGMRQGFVAVMMTHQVVPDIVRRGQARLTDVMPSYPRSSPVGENVDGDSHGVSVSQASPRSAPRSRTVRRSGSVVLLDSRDAGAWSPRARRALSEEPAARTGMGPVRRPWHVGGLLKHGRTYAPHLGTHFPDGFFDFNSTAPGVEMQRRSCAVIEMPSSPSPSPQRLESPPAHELHRMPSFTEVAIKQGYKPVQPRGFMSHRTAATRDTAASIHAPLEPIELDQEKAVGEEPPREPEPAPITTARTRHASMTDFILSSVTSLAAALQAHPQAPKPVFSVDYIDQRPSPAVADDYSTNVQMPFERINPMRARRQFEPQAVGQPVITGVPIADEQSASRRPIRLSPVEQPAEKTSEQWTGHDRRRGPLYAYRSQKAPTAEVSMGAGARRYMGPLAVATSRVPSSLHDPDGGVQTRRYQQAAAHSSRTLSTSASGSASAASRNGAASVHSGSQAKSTTPSTTSSFHTYAASQWRSPVLDPLLRNTAVDGQQKRLGR